MGNKFIIDIKSFKASGAEAFPQVINQIEKRLGLKFVSESEAEGKVCYAHHPDIRPEYRETFTASHLHDYIYAVLHSQNLQLGAGVAEIPYPANAKVFFGS